MTSFETQGTSLSFYRVTVPVEGEGRERTGLLTIPIRSCGSLRRFFIIRIVHVQLHVFYGSSFSTSYLRRKE
ncbi:MAG: hypothetical protein C4293_18330 [Nitrospiraceae bacterium]